MIASLMSEPLRELLDSTPARTAKSLPTVLLFASERVQSLRVDAIYNPGSPEVVAALLDASKTINPDENAEVMATALGMASLRAEYCTGLTPDEAASFNRLGLKIRDALSKAWRDNSKCSTTRIYDSLRSIG